MKLYWEQKICLLASISSSNAEANPSARPFSCSFVMFIFYSKLNNRNKKNHDAVRLIVSPKVPNTGDPSTSQKCADNSTDTTALYHFNLPLYCSSTLYYCTLPVQSTTALQQCTLPLNRSSALYYCTVAVHSTTALQGRVQK